MNSARVRNDASSITVAPWVKKLARVGFASTAAVYIIIGLIAMGAVGGPIGDADTTEALQVIVRQPFGRVLLGIVALGLIGYAVWRFVSSFTDAEDQGNSTKGMLARTTGFFRGIIYLAFSLAALRIVFGSSAEGEGKHWTSRLMEAPFGKWLVVLAGLGIAAYAIYQIVLAWKAKLNDDLQLGSISASMRGKIVAISRFGIAARGVVFAIVGMSIAAAALRGRSGEQDAGDALQVLAGWSTWLLVVIGAGLIAYGIYQLINARYRVIRVT